MNTYNARSVSLAYCIDSARAERAAAWCLWRAAYEYAQNYRHPGTSYDLYESAMFCADELEALFDSANRQVDILKVDFFYTLPDETRATLRSPFNPRMLETVTKLINADRAHNRARIMDIEL